ncbi:pimeloyl-ACP methyl ester carboxylesterase [Arthrobacter sp. CAN_A6]|uniref:alpha/beta fold hydrolase n=1 Tax=Arthrobacter sp. CAN_A6 TaxID=2787721 RepID=UPI0018CBDC19
MTQERIVFVHGGGSFGAAAWPRQHGLSLDHDCLFLRRYGFDADAEPLPTDHAEDERIITEALGGGGHLVAHSQGAVSAMLTAVERPDLIRSLTLVEPACLSLTADLPATAAHIDLVAPLFARQDTLTDEEFLQRFVRLTLSSEAEPPTTSEARRNARRLRLQAPPWTAPLHIVPGIPTLVLTGGWEPLYEEVAEYLAGTGAQHRITAGGHRPHDTAEGDAVVRGFIRGTPSGTSLPE